MAIIIRVQIGGNVEDAHSHFQWVHWYLPNSMLDLFEHDNCLWIHFGCAKLIFILATAMNWNGKCKGTSRIMQ